jgi:hypothetical protein
MTDASLTDPAKANSLSLPQAGRRESFLHQFDLVAMVITSLAIVLLGLAALALAVIELFKLTVSLWSEPLGRSVIIIVGLAIVWVVARWKWSHGG